MHVMFAVSPNRFPESCILLLHRVPGRRNNIQCADSVWADFPDRIAMTRTCILIPSSHPLIRLIQVPIVATVIWQGSRNEFWIGKSCQKVKNRGSCIFPGLAVKGGGVRKISHSPNTVWDGDDDDGAVSNWMSQGPPTTARTRTSSSLSPILPWYWDAPYAVVSGWQRTAQC